MRNGTSTKRARPSMRRLRRGVSLVEMMIGLALGMIASAALLLIFANASGRHADVQRTSAQIENGRYLAELLRDDLQLAGFFGEVPLEGAAYATPDPCQVVPTGFITTPRTLPTPVRGYGAAQSLPCLTAVSRLAGTDALAVRRVEVGTVDPAALPAGNRQYHLQPSFCSDDPAATAWVFDRDPAAFTLRNRACAAANLARAYVARLYFVATCNVCGSDTTPTLKRIDLQGDALVVTALVEGVEALRLEYGFDIDNDGNVDRWRTDAAPTGPESLWQNVMALRVHYVVRSLERVAGGSGGPGAQSFELGGAGSVDMPDDGFARRAYSITVRLVNPSGARENP